MILAQCPHEGLYGQKNAGGLLQGLGEGRTGKIPQDRDLRKRHPRPGQMQHVLLAARRQLVHPHQAAATMKTPGAGSPSWKITSPFLYSRRTAMRTRRFRVGPSTWEKKAHAARTSAISKAIPPENGHVA